MAYRFYFFHEFFYLLFIIIIICYFEVAQGTHLYQLLLMGFILVKNAIIIYHYHFHAFSLWNLLIKELK